MKKIYQLSLAFALISGLIVFTLSCQRDYKAEPTVAPAPVSPVPTGSFSESFDASGDITKKGWVFVNNSDPIGEAGWRTGRYEQINLANKKLTAGVVAVGFPAYRATSDPHDFMSCDITACGNQTGTGNWSAWLISPAVPMKNGDSIIFYTIANDFNVDPSNGLSTSDRLQVRLNITDGSAYVGGDTASVGNFTRVIYDSNPAMNNNISGGHPTTWTRVARAITGIPGGSVASGRFAFRYYIHDGGLYGGSTASIFPSVVGVDEVQFKH
jgi:hypothetical protein